ncbi:FHA domain-containing protein [bacterium]|nr:FHA domain-containing protein [bacterium]
MKKLNLGKILNEINENPIRAKEHEIKIIKNGSILCTVSKDPEEVYALAKTIIEDFYLAKDNVFIIDNNGYLSSIGLVFDPDNIDEIALSIPYDKGELPDLKAMEFSAIFKEKMDTFDENEDFNRFRDTLHFNILYEGLKGHRRTFNMPLMLDFSKSKDFSQEYLEYYVNFINENYSVSNMRDDLNLVKYFAGIAIKNKLKFKSMPELFEFFDSMKNYAEKLNISQDKLDKFIKKIKNKFTKFRDLYFDGTPFTEELFLNLSSVHNITSLFIESDDVSYKEFESLVILKKVLTAIITNFSKEILLVLDLNGLPNLYKTISENIDFLKNSQNANILIIGDPNSIKTIPEMEIGSDYFYYKNLDVDSNYTPITKENVYGEKIKGNMNLLLKRPEFSITKKIGSNDILKLKISDEYTKYLTNSDAAQKRKISKLVVKDGPLTGKEILLNADEYIFGRNEFFPSNKLISRRHFKLEFDGENYFISDTSVNGTFINNQKISKSVLTNGDLITLGNNEIVVLFQEE